ncbi:hypothetical protein BAUCODRAFT_376310 [Baudoinia panamericana UAMH 10762]|uniref:Uncharacterized protein n=1 Tax=Baudoinia panamericana (strain UAMH 10762) TaxID=717646 RepID=M2NH30_BAUPA|nr:uncharacterized protein BAUCODRAFT_376310 [Baudoinia panamericana UAMH 10762]EMC98634.1 hypothetical protein BAUCODRAFT_376310 [Baudoinia panamericana UAMH 10762]
MYVCSPECQVVRCALRPIHVLEISCHHTWRPMPACSHSRTNMRATTTVCTIIGVIVPELSACAVRECSPC